MFWNLAEASVPMTQRAVMAMITSTARTITTGVLPARSSSPKARRPNRTATSASDPTTSTPVIEIAHPPIHPNHGPIARVTHENVVPQSGSTPFR